MIKLLKGRIGELPQQLDKTSTTIPLNLELKYLHNPDCIELIPAVVDEQTLQTMLVDIGEEQGRHYKLESAPIKAFVNYTNSQKYEILSWELDLFEYEDNGDLAFSYLAYPNEDKFTRYEVFWHQWASIQNTIREPIKGYFTAGTIEVCVPHEPIWKRLFYKVPITNKFSLKPTVKGLYKLPFQFRDDFVAFLKNELNISSFKSVED